MFYVWQRCTKCRKWRGCESAIGLCESCWRKDETMEKHWNVITHCARKDVWDQWIPAEWFILNAPFASKEEAEAHQAAVEANTAGTDADWPEAYAAKKIAHDDELAQYGLKPLN